MRLNNGLPLNLITAKVVDIRFLIWKCFKIRIGRVSKFEMRLNFYFMRIHPLIFHQSKIIRSFYSCFFIYSLLLNTYKTSLKPRDGRGVF
jgi:hypothetical protein